MPAQNPPATAAQTAAATTAAAHEAAAPLPPTAATVHPTPAVAVQSRVVQLRDKDGRLTREGMEHAIRSGGSVLVDGRTDPVTDVAYLPTAADLAKGDPVAEANAKAALIAERNRINAELDKLLDAKTGK